MSSIQVRLFSGTDSPVSIGSLANAREHSIEGLQGDESRSLEIVNLPRASAPSIFSRTTRTESVTLNVAKLHADVSAGLLYWLKHPAAVPLVCDVEFRQGNATAWLNGAGVQSVKRVDRPGGGVTTIFSYDIVGGTWSNQRE